MQHPSNRSHLSKFPENWENIGNFAPFGPCGGLIGAQFQKLAGKIPMHGNWEFILRKWENAKRKNGINGKSENGRPSGAAMGTSLFVAFSRGSLSLVDCVWVANDSAART